MIDDLVSLVILVEKEHYFPKSSIQCILYPKEWLKYKKTCGERWIIETLKVMSRSDQIISSRLEVTEDPYWGLSQLIIIYHRYFIIKLI